MTAPVQHITLSELQRHIKQALEGALPLPVWVVAEVSELKVNYSGHCYLELVEKSEPARGARPFRGRRRGPLSGDSSTLCSRPTSRRRRARVLPQV